MFDWFHTLAFGLSRVAKDGVLQTMRSVVNFTGGVTITDEGGMTRVHVAPSGLVDGTAVGRPLAWSGSVWQQLAAALDLGGNPVRNARNFRSASVSIPTGGSSTNLLTAFLYDILTVETTGRNTVGLRVVIEDSDGANEFVDDIELDLKGELDSIFKAKLWDHRNNANSNGPVTTATITIAGPQSGYQYTIVADANIVNMQFTVSIAQDAAVARKAVLTAWWDQDITGWNAGSW